MKKKNVIEKINSNNYKTILKIVFICLLLVAISAFIRSDGNYSIDWSTIDGGGAVSNGGIYTLSGTIGQPDTSILQGGQYSLSGGFWGTISILMTIKITGWVVH